MRVLIIGGTGYIGSYLVHKFDQDERIEEIYVMSRRYKDFLRAYKDKVSYVGQDISDLKGLREKLAKIKPDIILHLAAVAKGDYVQLIETNVVGTIHVLEVAREMPIRLLVFASTAANLYGNAIYKPIDEKHPLNPISPYGLSKQMAEDAVRFYARRYDVPAVIFRQTNVYGWAPVMKRTLINAFIESALKDGVLRIFGTGKQQRNFLYIDDLAKYYEAIIFYDSPEELRGEIFNVAGPQTATVLDVAKIVKEISEQELALKVKIRWEDSEKDKGFEVYNFPISYEKAKEILGVEPRVDLRTGIRIELKRRTRK